MADFTVDRELAGGAKNILDDLTELNRKIPLELERGVRDGYLETEKVAGLAEKLGVEKPRIRTRRWVYVEHRQIQSIPVDAYDDEDALRIVNEGYGRYLRRGEIPGGFRASRWADRDAGSGNRLVSEPQTTRPRLNDDLRFYLNRTGEPRSLRQPTGDVVPEQVEVPVTEPDTADEARTRFHQFHQLMEQVAAARQPVRVAGAEAVAINGQRLTATSFDDEPI